MDCITERTRNLLGLYYGKARHVFVVPVVERSQA